MSGDLPWTLHDDHVRLAVRLTPNARTECIEGITALSDGKRVLVVRVRAVPVEGAANAALEKLIAKTAGVAKSRVAVVSGMTQRLKILRIEGDSRTIAAALLAVCR